MATGQSPDADTPRKSRPVAGAGARLYTASTATTALTCHHIDIVIICKCACTYSRRWGLESNVVLDHGIEKEKSS